MIGRQSFRLQGLLVTFLVAASLLLAFRDDTIRPSLRRSLQDDQQELSPGLAGLLPQLTKRSQLDTIYKASSVDGETTLTRAVAACGDCQSFSLYGNAVNWNSPIFPPGDWIGKTINGRRDAATGEFTFSIINNYADGGTRYPAKLYIEPVQKALGSIFPFTLVFGFPPFKSLESGDSLIIDYRPDWTPGIDGARPVTQTGLEAAGLAVEEDITDLWAGYLVFTFLGIFNLYSHHFLVQFDFDNISIMP